MNKKVLAVMIAIVALLVVLNIEVSGVGAATTQTPQQMKTALFKDLKAVTTNENAKTCNKLKHDAWKDEHQYKPVNDIVRTIWVEMTSELNQVGFAECNNLVYNTIQKQDIKRAKFRSNELDVRWAEGQGVQQYEK